MNRNIGIATAYGYALSKGYTGTEEEFAEDQARLASAAAKLTGWVTPEDYGAVGDGAFDDAPAMKAATTA